MDQEANTPEKLKDNFTGLLDDYRDLLSIKIAEHASKGMSEGIIGGAKLIVILFILLFTGLGAAWWYGEYIGNLKIGFFMVGAVFTFLFIVLILSQKALLPRLRNFIIKKIYEQH